MCVFLVHLRRRQTVPVLRGGHAVWLLGLPGFLRERVGAESLLAGRWQVDVPLAQGVGWGGAGDVARLARRRCRVQGVWRGEEGV